MDFSVGARAMLLAACFGVSGLAAQTPVPSCIKCHASAATMQKLVVPPKGPAAEGEG